MYRVVASNKFKKDFKLCLKRGLKENWLEDVLYLLEKNGKLPQKYKPHKLSGQYSGLWECHIKSDWLLIWNRKKKSGSYL